MRKTSALLTLALLVACESSSSPPPDDDGAGGNGGSTSAPLHSPHVEQDALTSIVEELASDAFDGRDEGTPGGEQARALIVEKMKACGLEPGAGESFEQPITTGDGVNVLGLVPGSDPELSERAVIVSAHYDHLGHCEGDICNGADDNAAGVAAALGVGCALAETPPARTVMIAAWDAEEPPTFLTEEMGSRFYADNPTWPLDATDAVVVLDLIGGDLWPGFGGHFLLGAELSPQVAAAIHNAPQPEGLMALRGGLHLAEEQPTGHQPWSDYDAFRNAGRPVLFLSNGQNQRYHTPADELGMVNMPKVALEAKYLLRIVHNLATGPDPATFVPDGADYATDADTVIAVLEAALAEGGLVDSLGLSSASRSKLEGDLEAAQEVASAIADGQQPSDPQVRRLRDGTQRVMCYAGPLYDESTCNLF